MSKDKRRAIEALRKLVGDLDDLIADSTGVSGLHHNGDVAPWSELVAGGQFETWLKSLDDARNVLRQVEQAELTPAIPTYTEPQVAAAIWAVADAHGKPQWYESREDFVNDILTHLTGGGGCDPDESKGTPS